MGDGMHDACGHHHRLAGAGTRDDELRAQVMGGDGELVVGEVDAEELAQIRAVRVRLHHHGTTWSPASVAGHDVR